MSAPLLRAPLALYAGSANTWECDEMGHLNVRFYVARAMEGLGFLAAHLGMADAFGRQARSTLAVKDQHIRFLKEARPGDPLTMVGGLTAVTDTEAVVYQELRHGDGTPAATFHTRVAHAEPASLRPFPWSERVRARAEALVSPLPAHAAPRSLDTQTPGLPEPSLEAARALGAHRIGAGVVTADQTDAFGRMRAELFIGRISDAVPNLLHGWRQEVAKAAGAAEGKAKIAGAAVVEYRLLYRDWPRVGAAVEVYSGVVALEGKTHRLAHWLLDPISGRAYATTEAVALTFDLKTRKAIQPPPAQLATLEALMTPGMTL